MGEEPVITSEEDIRSNAREGVDGSKGESIHNKSVAGEDIIAPYGLPGKGMNVPLVGNGTINEEIEKDAHSISALDLEDYTIRPTSDYGDSWYDSKAHSREDYEDLNEVRAREQGLPEKLIGGFGRYVATTGLGTLGNIVGTVVGIGEGIHAAATKDGNAWENFWNGFITNSVNEFVHDALDEVNRFLPTYKSKEEESYGVLRSIFTGNFWADQIANMGWTSSAILSTVLTGGMGAASGASALARVLGASKGAQSLIYRFVGAATGGISEAATDAIDTYHKFIDNSNDNLNEKERLLNEKIQAEIQAIYDEVGYGKQRHDADGRPIPIVINPYFEEGVRNRVLANHAAEFAEIERQRNTVNDNALNAARRDFGLEEAILTGTNMFGVFSNIKAPMQNAQRVARGSITNIVRRKGAEVAASKGELYAGRMVEVASEAIQEGGQHWASEASMAYFGQEYDPRSIGRVKDWLTVAGEQFTQTLEDKDGLQEMLAGAFGAVLGAGGARKVSKKGKDGKYHTTIAPEWTGGIWGMRKEINEINKTSTQIYDEANKFYNDKNLQRRIRYMAGMLADNNEMLQAASVNDKKKYMDAADNQALRTIEVFADLGRLGDLRAMLGKNDNISDEELERFAQMQASPILDENNNPTGRYESNLGLVDVNGELITNSEEGRNKLRERLVTRTNEILGMIDTYNDAIERADQRTGYQLDRETLARFAWGSVQAENADRRAGELIEKNKDIIKQGLTGVNSVFSESAKVQIDKTIKNLEKELVRTQKKKDFDGKQEMIDNINTAIKELTDIKDSDNITQEDNRGIENMFTNKAITGSLLNTKVDDKHYIADKLIENLADKNLLTDDVKQDINDIVRLYRARDNYDQMVDEWAGNPKELIELMDREADIITNRNIRDLADRLNDALSKKKINNMTSFRKHFNRIAKEVGITDDNFNEVLKQAAKKNKDLILYGNSLLEESRIVSSIQNNNSVEDAVKNAAVNLMLRNKDLFQRLKYASQEQIIRHLMPNFGRLSQADQELIERATALIYNTKENLKKSSENSKKDTAAENSQAQQQNNDVQTDNTTQNNSNTQTAETTANNPEPTSLQKVSEVLEVLYKTYPEDSNFDAYYDECIIDIDNISNAIKDKSVTESVDYINSLFEIYTNASVIATHDDSFKKVAALAESIIRSWYSKSGLRTALPFETVSTDNNEVNLQFQPTEGKVEMVYTTESGYPIGTSMVESVSVKEDNGKLVQTITISRNIEEQPQEQSTSEENQVDNTETDLKEIDEGETDNTEEGEEEGEEEEGQEEQPEEQVDEKPVDSSLENPAAVTLETDNAEEVEEEEEEGSEESDEEEEEEEEEEENDTADGGDEQVDEKTDKPDELPLSSKNVETIMGSQAIPPETTEQPVQDKDSIGDSQKQDGKTETPSQEVKDGSAALNAKPVVVATETIQPASEVQQGPVKPQMDNPVSVGETNNGDNKSKPKKKRFADADLVPQNAIVFSDLMRYTNGSMDDRTFEEKKEGEDISKDIAESDTWNYMFNGRLAEFMKKNPDAPLYLKYSKDHYGSVKMYVKDNDRYVFVGYIARRTSGRNGAYAITANLLDSMFGDKVEYRQAFYRGADKNVRASNINCTAVKNEDGYFVVTNTDGKPFSINGFVNGVIPQSKGVFQPVSNVKNGTKSVVESYKDGEMFYGVAMDKKQIEVHNGKESITISTPHTQQVGMATVAYKGFDGNWITSTIKGKPFASSDIIEYADNKIVKKTNSFFSTLASLINNESDFNTISKFITGREGEKKYKAPSLNNCLMTFNVKVSQKGGSIVMSLSMKDKAQQVVLSKGCTIEDVAKAFEQLGVAYNAPNGENDSFLDFAELAETDIVNFQQTGKLLVGFEKDAINEKNMLISESDIKESFNRYTKSINGKNFIFSVRGNFVGVQKEGSSAFFNHRELALLMDINYVDMDSPKVYTTVQTILEGILTDYSGNDKIIKVGNKKYLYIPASDETIEVLFDIDDNKAVEMPQSLRALLKTKGANKPVVSNEPQSDSKQESQPAQITPQERAEIESAVKEAFSDQLKRIFGDDVQFLSNDEIEAKSLEAQYGEAPFSRRKYRTIFNHDLTKDEIEAIQTYIETLDKDTDVSYGLYFEKDGFIYKFNTSLSQYVDNRNDGRDGFEITDKADIRNLTQEQLSKFKDEYKQGRTFDSILSRIRNEKGSGDSSILEDKNGQTSGNDVRLDGEALQGEPDRGQDNRNSGDNQRTGEVTKGFSKTDGDIYGFAYDGRIFLNRDKFRPDTPVHEYTHLWDEALLRIAETNEAARAFWNRGVELMKKTTVWQDVITDPAYADIRNDEEEVATEVHARLSGMLAAGKAIEFATEDKGEGRKGWWNRLMEWFEQFKDFTLQNIFGLSKEYCSEITLEQFVNAPISDFLMGTDPRQVGKNTYVQPTQIQGRTTTEKTQNDFEVGDTVQYATNINGENAVVAKKAEVKSITSKGVVIEFNGKALTVNPKNLTKLYSARPSSKYSGKERNVSTIEQKLGEPLSIEEAFARFISNSNITISEQEAKNVTDVNKKLVASNGFTYDDIASQFKEHYPQFANIDDGTIRTWINEIFANEGGRLGIEKYAAQLHYDSLDREWEAEVNAIEVMLEQDEGVDNNETSNEYSVDSLQSQDDMQSNKPIEVNEESEGKDKFADNAIINKRINPLGRRPKHSIGWNKPFNKDTDSINSGANREAEERVNIRRRRPKHSKSINLNTALSPNANVLLSSKKFVDDALNEFNRAGQVQNLINAVQEANTRETKSNILELFRSVANNRKNMNGVRLSELTDNELMEQYLDATFGDSADTIFKNVQEMLEMFESPDFVVQVLRQSNANVPMRPRISSPSNSFIKDKINECN